MKLKYYPETDTLYIELKETPSVESEEIADGVVLDYDNSGEIVGIEIEKSQRKKRDRNTDSRKIPYGFSVNLKRFSL